MVELKQYRTTNGETITAIKVATVEQVVPYTYTRNYETAAWYRRELVQEGTTAEVWVKVRFDRETNRYRSVFQHDAVTYALPCTCVGSDFTSRLGASYGAPKVDEHVGETGTIVLGGYVHGLIDKLLTGELDACGRRFKPCAGVSIITTFHNITRSSSNRLEDAAAGLTEVSSLSQFEVDKDATVLVP